jgi:hypothetical protein
MDHPNVKSQSPIDALKRLERVGSEDSKTTQKLLAAATELSKLIVERFAAIGVESVRISSFGMKRYGQSMPGLSYEIEKGKLYRALNGFRMEHPLTETAIRR